jgi:hypothetical protein
VVRSLALKVDKVSVSFPPDLGDAIREAAKRRGRGLSAWLAEAAQSKLRSEALGDLLDDWEREHGPFTAEDLATARRQLGLEGLTTGAD